MGGCTHIRSRDVAAVEETWRAVAPSSRLEPVAYEQFGYEWRSVSAGALTVVDYELTAHVRSAVNPKDQLFTCRVQGPNARVGTERREFAADHPWAYAGTEVTAEWDGTARVRALVFDLDHAQIVARRISGDDGLMLRVTDPRPATLELSRYWSCVYDHVGETLLARGENHPMIEAQLRSYALRAALAVFPNTLHGALDWSPQRGPAETAVRRARAFMDEHAHEPITVDEVAAAVHLSTRGLQSAFKRATGDTPTEYLRRVRLVGAHADLMHGDRVSIADVAAKWGFTHRSRFAKYYREQYGHRPSEASAQPSTRNA